MQSPKKMTHPGQFITWMISLFIVRNTFLRTSMLLMWSYIPLLTRMMMMVMMPSTSATRRLIYIISVFTPTRARRRWRRCMLKAGSSTIAVRQTVGAIYVTVSIDDFWFPSNLVQLGFIFLMNLYNFSNEEKKMTKRVREIITMCLFKTDSTLVRNK